MNYRSSFQTYPFRRGVRKISHRYFRMTRVECSCENDVPCIFFFREGGCRKGISLWNLSTRNQCWNKPVLLFNYVCIFIKICIELVFKALANLCRIFAKIGILLFLYTLKTKPHTKTIVDESLLKWTSWSINSQLIYKPVHCRKFSRIY